METDSDLSSLIDILKRAYSGELAAAYAYRGHWKSLSDPAEIASVKQIEDDEWVHRENIARMMKHLKVGPGVVREVRCWIVGRIIAIGCHLTGWFLPMYFAGRLESGNTIEYENAARHAARLSLADFESELLVMSRVEKEHELFFLGVISKHPWLPFVSRMFKWGAPGASAIAASRIGASAIATNPIVSDSIQEMPASTAAGIHPEQRV